MEEEKNLNVIIEIHTTDLSDLSAVIKKVEEIQKEHSCNCTLNVVLLKSPNVITLGSSPEL